MKLRSLGVAVAVLGLSTSLFVAPAQAAAPPIDNTWGTLTSTCTSKTIYGGLVNGSTGTGGGAGGVGWTSVGALQVCLQVKGTKIRALGTFIMYKGWTWDEGYFNAWVSKCNGAEVTGSGYVSSTSGTTTTFNYQFASNAVTRGASYQAAAFVTTGSIIRSSAGDRYVFQSVTNWPTHTKVQTNKSTCST